MHHSEMYKNSKEETWLLEHIGLSNLLQKWYHHLFLWRKPFRYFWLSSFIDKSIFDVRRFKTKSYSSEAHAQCQSGNIWHIYYHFLVYHKYYMTGRAEEAFVNGVNPWAEFIRLLLSLCIAFQLLCVPQSVE